MKFDYMRDIEALNREEKINFYLAFANRLTTANRIIWSDADLSLTDQVEGMKWLNEVMHRVLNRLDDLLRQDDSFTDADVWSLIKQHVSQNKAIGGDVRFAIEQSYNWVTEGRAQPAKL